MDLRRPPLAALAAVLGLAAAGSPASAATPDRTLRADLTRLAPGAGGSGGFVVLDGAGGTTLAAGSPA